MFIVNDKIRIPPHELEFEYARSSGPGGQAVNKVSSKALLRWDISRTSSIPDDVKQRFLARFANRITKSGELVLSSDAYRERSMNKDACLQKLKHMLLAVAATPKIRKKTKPTRASVLRRKQAKRLHAEKKESRKKRLCDREC